MNADDMKGLFERSLREGGMDSAPAPDETSIAGRVQGARRRRAAGSVMASVASVALVAAVVWQMGGFTNDPNPPATPTTTVDPTDEPTGDPSQTSTDGPTDEPTGGDSPSGAVLHDFSDAVFPECGDSFTLPDRQSELVVEGGPSEALPAFGGGWTATVTNDGSELIQGQIGMMQLVVVDGDGQVVAAPDPDDPIFLGPEGSFWMGVAAGDALEVEIPMTHGCETGDWLPAGDYEAYGAITFVGENGTYEQAQGGPWPITIGDGEASPVEPKVPTGTVPIDLACGASWTDPNPTTGYGIELLDQIVTPRSSDRPIDGRAVVSITQPIDAPLFLEVAVLQDGLVVAHMPGSDTNTSVAATAGTSVPLTFGTEFLDCDTSLSAGADTPTLPPGEYQVAVVALTFADGATDLIATTELVDVVLE